MRIATPRIAPFVLAPALAITACTPASTEPARLVPAAVQAPTTAAPSDLSWFKTATYPNEVNDAVEVKAIVVSVYDGDTATVVRLSRTDAKTVVANESTVRIAHIDAPELNKCSAASRAAGRAARDRLRELLPVGQVITMYDLQDDDKYGRALAQLATPDRRNVAQVMLEEGHAYPYEGGTRECPTENSPPTNAPSSHSG